MQMSSDEPKARTKSRNLRLRLSGIIIANPLHMLKCVQMKPKSGDKA